MSPCCSTHDLFQNIRWFRDRISAGQKILGAAITLNDPLVSEALADSVDFLWYDLEHIQLDPAALNGHLMAARHRNTPALVRIADVNPATVKPVLDAGADGLIAAQVRSLDEVQRFVNHCLYPPLGQRGAGPRIPTNFGRDSGPDYFKLANESIYISVMIETIEALEVIDQIVRVDRLDSITIGPFDLSAALGHLGELDHPKVVDAMQHIIDTAQSAGVHVGAGMGANPQFASAMFARGVQWVQMGSDYEYMIHHFEACRIQVLQSEPSHGH